MSVPLLVFLHGLGATPQMWQDQVVAMPAGTKAVAPWLDGLRPGRPGDFDLERAADKVLEQLNTFGVDAVALVGSGLGASVAVTAAGRSPAAVSHLVLTGMIPRAPRGSGLLQRLAVRAIPSGRLADAGLDRARMRRLLKAASGLDLRPWLPSVTARTLVVAGEGDAAGRESGQALVDAVGGARLELVPGASTDLPTRAPAEFNRLLYGFLDE